MGVETLAIAVTAAGVLVARRAIESIGRAARDAEAPVVSLNRALSLVMAGGAVYKVGQTLNTFQQLRNGLMTVTDGYAEMVSVEQQLFSAAQNSRSSWEESLQVFVRVARATEQMGVKSTEAVQIVERLNKALQIGGASGQERYSVLIQFTQALASGRLQGDELRSILENSTVLGNLIAKQMGVTRGELRKLGSEGKITSVMLVEAFRKYGIEIDQLFAKTTPTIAQGFTMIRNQSTKALVEFDRNIGASEKFARALSFLNQNFEVMSKVAVPALMAVGAAILTAGAAAGGLLPLISRLAGLLLFNPVIAGIATIGALSLALYNFRNDITLTQDSATSLGDVLTVTMKRIDGLFSESDKAMKDFLANFKVDFGGWNLQNVLTNTAKEIDNMVALWSGFRAALTVILNDIPIDKLLVSIWASVKSAFNDAMDHIYNKMVAFDKWVVAKYWAWRGMAGGGGVTDADLDLNERQASLGDRAGVAFSDAFNKVVKERVAGNLVDSIISDADTESFYRRVGEAMDNSYKGPLKAPGGPLKTPKADNSKEMGKLERELDGILRKSDTVAAAQRELERAEKVLSKAVAAGNITLDRKNMILAQMRFALQDNLDPYGHMIIKLQEEMDGLRMTSEQRAINNKLLENENKLREKGVMMTPQMREQMTAMLAGIESMKKGAELLRDAFTSAFSAMGDALVDFVFTGQINFRTLTESILKDLMRIAVRQAIVGPLANGLTSVFSGGNPFAMPTGGATAPTLFSSGMPSPLNGNPFPKPYADGGDFRAGQMMLVGERGPELLQLSRPGVVYPNGTGPAVGGGGGMSQRPEVRVYPPAGHEVREESKREGNRDVTEIMIINTVKKGQLRGDLDDVQQQRFRVAVPAKRR